MTLIIKKGIVHKIIFITRRSVSMMDAYRYLNKHAIKKKKKPLCMFNHDPIFCCF